MRPCPVRARWVAAAIGMLVALTACGQDSEDVGLTDKDASDEVTAPGPVPDEEADPEPELHVVAKLPPIADLVEMVGGERVEVSSLVPAGADSHTYEPRPSDVARLADADAFIGIGLELNPGAVSLASENLPEDSVVLLGELYLDREELVFDHVHGDDGHTHGDDGHTHGDDGHTHGDDGHTHGDDGHTHGDDGHTHNDDGHTHGDDGDTNEDPGANPHVWTGLAITADLVEGIAQTLSELDPHGAQDYRAGARQASTEIEALHERISEAAATIPEEDRTLVVYHDAWSYFARDYGLEMVTAVQPSDYSEPSAGEVRAIIDLIREHDVPALFGSEVFASDVLEVIAEETGAVYVGDLADDELPGEPGDPEHSYLGMMHRNAELIVEHLGGDADLLRP